MEENNVGTSESDNRLGLCEVCGESSAKYTCPRCATKSCSLVCVKHHKNDLQCNGERDKTAFKKLSEFTNLDLLSDYRMLEETTRSVENYYRDPLKRFTRWNRSLPVHLHRLQGAVSYRGSKLMYLPQHFSRHKNNTTFFNWKNQEILWRIEWVFPQADFIKAVDERALEDTRISVLLEKYLDQNSCPKELQDNLQFYQSAGLSRICLLLKAEHVKKSSSRFFELDPSLTLKKALKNKTIIEFPTIYVVLSEHKEMFEVIESDDDQEEESGKLHIKEARNNQYTSYSRQHYSGRNVKRKNPKNLLFNECDSSDGSLSDEHLPSKRLCSRNSENDVGFNIPSYDELIHQNQ